MKISDINQQANRTQYVGQTGAAGSLESSPAPQDAGEKISSDDKVELSTQSREMQKIYDVLQSTPDVRAEKVADLKKRIEQGDYQVDQDALADKMIKESLMDLIR